MMSVTSGRGPTTDRSVGDALPWRRVYEGTPAEALSWYEAEPTLSLELIRAAAPTTSTRILDVGSGASRLVDRLLADAYRNIGVLDIAENALARTQERLGPAAQYVEWFSEDVLRFLSPHSWDIWHDRALFHFLSKEDRAAYRRVIVGAVPVGGQAIIATFARTGPERCSGRDVHRYDAQTLAAELGPDFLLLESRTRQHLTPAGVPQPFIYCRFLRRESATHPNRATP